MADNFLEKQMEAYRNGSGRTVIRKDNPSLDRLIRTTAEKTCVTDASYLIKQAQLDAAVRSASYIPGSEGFRFCSDESSATIRISWQTESTRDLLLAGEMILAVRLKAAELGLGTTVTPAGESESPLVATIQLFR